MVSLGSGVGAVSAFDSARPAGVAFPLGAALALAVEATPGEAAGEAAAEPLGVGAAVDGWTGGALAAATASTCRMRSSAVVDTSLSASSRPAPGIWITMLSFDFATWASEMPVPLTRCRMIVTARSRLSCEGVFPFANTGERVTVVPPARSRPNLGTNAF